MDKARSREKGGVGLGLAIAKEMIDKYDGQITIDSEVSKGTTVELSIPRGK
ncbi:ATP-binding protein [Parageobacillus toebii]|nr:ATP-binding protein [Parageobacillus toebii]MED4970021.1 ATP-binding protein [Parageobacillus toebii]WMT18889.1 ATP-binding protein [Parageobacillus toebii]